MVGWVGGFFLGVYNIIFIFYVCFYFIKLKRFVVEVKGRLLEVDRGDCF